MAERFASVDDVTDRLRGADYLADSAISGVVFLADRLEKPVLVNASTRFTDGGEFGFGAEIGISTQKLHARGPMGLPEMTSTKYVVVGDGHIR